MLQSWNGIRFVEEWRRADRRADEHSRCMMRRAACGEGKFKTITNLHHNASNAAIWSGHCRSGQEEIRVIFIPDIGPFECASAPSPPILPERASLL